MNFNILIIKLKESYKKLTIPQFTIITGFIIICLGTVILSTPLCSSSKVGIWEAFFTSTSAITVTGLTVIDVGKDLTVLGQIFLAFMLLSGGLGLMAITTFLQGFVVKGAKLRVRLDKGNTLDEFGVGGIGRTFKSITITAAIIISLGSLILYCFGFIDISNNWERLWASIFHSISAYNNAGFSIWSSSMYEYRTNFLVNFVFICLIILGGLGWRVIDDIWSNRKNLSYKKLSLHSKLVLRTTFNLIVFGSFGFLITESLLNGQFFDDLNIGERMLASLFETVSARTAGFTNYPISLDTISDTGVLLLMTLMFIGASTGGTGGGIKTTTFIALMAATRSTLRGQKDVIISNRLISDKVILKAVGITVGSLLFVLLMAMLLSTTNTFINREKFTFLEMLFTCISAFATVGFDIGLTIKLNHFGQFILIVGMFVGRLGILLFLSALWEALYKSRINKQKRIGYPKADLYV